MIQNRDGEKPFNAFLLRHLIHRHREPPKLRMLVSGNPDRGPPCLAAARAQNGSDVINVIHHRSAASLPTGEGLTIPPSCLRKPPPFTQVEAWKYTVI